MIQDIERLLDDYVTWLKEKTLLRQVEQWVEITTPYIDRHNDYIQIYARKSDSGYNLTDGGYIIDDLELTGCTLNSPKRRELLKTTLNGFGVKFMDGKLEVQASNENFALRKHNLVQAMLAVNDMFYLAESSVASLFCEDVEAWLNDNEVRYTPKVKFSGKSGYDHLFDFVIPKSRSQPERIVQAINRPDRNTAQKVAFAWIDTKEVRPSDSKAYTFLNDTEREVSTAVTEALTSYNVQSVPWSERESVLEELAA